MSDTLSRVGGPENTASRAVRLAIAFAAVQFGLHAWFALSAGDPHMLMPHAVAWLQDLLVLAVLIALLYGFGIALQRTGLPRRPLAAMGTTVIFAVGLLLASYPGLLAEFLAFPVNVLRAELATASFMVSEYIGWQGLWPVALSGVVAGLAGFGPWWPARTDRPVRRRRSVALAAVAALGSLLGVATLLSSAPQPLIYSIQDSARGWLFGGQRVVPSLVRPTAASEAPSGEAVVGAPSIEETEELRYDHILILVFEGVTTGQFEKDFLTRPGGFYARVRDRSAYFDRYHATNLDSFTSLIAMLTSVQVPYRAYARPHVYASVSEAPNFVASLRRRGYHSLFVCTAKHQPFVPVRTDWSRIVGMQDVPHSDDWVTLGGSRVESAVEDRAAIPEIVRFVKSHPRTLIMHEMVFGHSPRWIAKTGKRQLEYYDAYLQELLGELEQPSRADRALLVVVADHGDRANPADVANYRVPLLVSGRGIAPLRSSGHYSHKDLQGILRHFLAGDELPEAAESLLTVGSTGRWVYGEIRPDGDYLFIDNGTGSVLTRHGTLDAAVLYERFQQAINLFAARFQRG